MKLNRSGSSKAKKPNPLVCIPMVLSFIFQGDAIPVTCGNQSIHEKATGKYICSRTVYSFDHEISALALEKLPSWKPVSSCDASICPLYGTSDTPLLDIQGSLHPEGVYGACLINEEDPAPMIFTLCQNFNQKWYAVARISFEAKIKIDASEGKMRTLLDELKAFSPLKKGKNEEENLDGNFNLSPLLHDSDFDYVAYMNGQSPFNSFR